MSVTVDGTSGVSAVQDGTINSAKIVNGSVAQADLGANVAGTGPAFEAYLQNPQTVTTNTLTKIQLDIKVFDTTNAFDNITNYRFQPSIAGYYQINTRMRGDATTSLGNFSLSIYKNGTQYERVCEAVQGSATTISGSCLVYLNGTTDYIEFFGTVVGTGTCTFSTAGDTTGLYGPRVSCYLARSA